MTKKIAALLERCFLVLAWTSWGLGLFSAMFVGLSMWPFLPATKLLSSIQTNLRMSPDDFLVLWASIVLAMVLFFVLNVFFHLCSLALQSKPQS